ncbi:short-subunit dehydrogenase [Clostridium saccharoperbutylacetonicum]|uniref:SDR family oxidoreductase n=1 Tax=Clostridium saccharoperbutylacetonicum TaxID=36745 RepID=UPI00156DAE24|nr:SDR family oxidoreductase [Clostridium saccharoperbutylacetonicum]NSB44921.1 short-subunit dehydrogenase [Clostridium saccharoperbutylacetonicum]
MEKKTVVITGASSGIGKETAKYFAEKGWKVAATMRSPERETELTQIENVKIYSLDVTNQETISKTYEGILKEFGTIDVLVNNAGYSLFGPFEISTDEQIRREFDVNVFGLFNTTRTFLKHFRENKKGIIVNVASSAGKTTLPFISTYNSTKFAVEGFTESLSYELNDFGIKVKLIEPGVIKTDFTGRSIDHAKSETITDYNASLSNFYSLATGDSQQISSEPTLVAEVIYEAVTDGTNTLRYIAGEDAKQAISIRETQGDEAYVSMIKERFALK